MLFSSLLSDKLCTVKLPVHMIVLCQKLSPHVVVVHVHTHTTEVCFNLCHVVVIIKALRS